MLLHGIDCFWKSVQNNKNFISVELINNLIIIYMYFQYSAFLSNKFSFLLLSLLKLCLTDKCSFLETVYKFVFSLDPTIIWKYIVDGEKNMDSSKMYNSFK